MTEEIFSTQDAPRVLPEVTSAEIKTVQAFAEQKDTAILTVMFTDIEGFTRMTDRKGDAFSMRLLELHNHLLEDHIERAGAGRIVKTLGDGVLAVFAEPSTSVACALAIQEALDRDNRQHPDRPALKVRIGIHMGQVTLEGDVERDVFGGHVNRAARVESIARGGQIYVTHSVYENAHGFITTHRDRSIAWQAHGRHAVRGIDEPLDIYEVGLEGLTKFAPPRTGANCRKISLTATSPARRLRMSVVAAVLIALSAATIVASIRMRVGRHQREARGIVAQVLRDNPLRVSPPLDRQQRMMPADMFTPGNAALDYVRIPAMRAESLRQRSEMAKAASLSENVRADWATLERLAAWWVATKAHSYLTRAGNQMTMGETPDLDQPIFTLDHLTHLDERPDATSAALDALELGAHKADCEFFPQLFPFPRSLHEFAVFNRRAVSLVHQAQSARALIHELNGDTLQAQRALECLLRFNFHLSEAVYSYSELEHILTLRRTVVLALLDLHKRGGNMEQAGRWSLFLSSQVTLMRDMERVHAALFDRGYTRAYYGALAGDYLLEHAQEPFWRLQGALSLGLTRASRWNVFDRRAATAALDQALESDSGSARHRAMLDVYARLGPHDIPGGTQVVSLLQ